MNEKEGYVRANTKWLHFLKKIAVVVIEDIIMLILIPKKDVKGRL